MTGTPVVNSRSGGQGTDARVIKHSIVRDGHKSSVSLETPFWEAFREIASDRKMMVSELVATIDHGRNRYNLSSAIRVFVLGHFRRNSEHNIAVGPIRHWHRNNCAGTTGLSDTSRNLQRSDASGGRSKVSYIPSESERIDLK